MVCTLHYTIIQDIIHAVQCMEAICEYIRVDLVAPTLTLQSSDHSNAITTIYTLPVTIAMQTAPINRIVTCNSVLQSLAGHGIAYLVVTNGVFSVHGSDPLVSVQWVHCPLMLPHHQRRTTSDTVSQLLTQDFILYCQQIVLCEQLVDICSYGAGDLSFRSNGEIAQMSIRDQHHCPTSTPIYHVTCAIKYIRAFTHLLGTHLNTVTIQLHHTTCMYMNLQDTQLIFWHLIPRHSQ